MSVWSLRWHFTNKSVTGAPYSIKSYNYSVSQSWALWWRVRWLKQCRLEVAAELKGRPTVKIVNFWKFKMAPSAISKKVEKCYVSATTRPILTKLKTSPQNTNRKWYLDAISVLRCRPEVPSKLYRPGNLDLARNLAIVGGVNEVCCAQTPRLCLSFTSPITWYMEYEKL